MDEEEGFYSDLTKVYFLILEFNVGTTAFDIFKKTHHITFCIYKVKLNISIKDGNFSRKLSRCEHTKRLTSI